MRSVLAAIVALAGWFALQPVQAADFFWNVSGPADWNNALDWSPSTRVPGGGGNSADTATILNGGTATITVSPPALSEIDLGESNSTLVTNTVNHSAGTVTVNNDLILGLYFPGPGVYNQSGGIVNLGGAVGGGSLYLGQDTGTAGAYNLTGGTLNASIAGQDSYVGFGGNGTVSQSGASVANFQQNAPADASALYLGYLAGSNGQYTLGGTATLHAWHDEYIGLEGNGTFTQNGGTHIIERILDIADQSTSTSTFNMQGGTLTVNSGMLVGASGRGMFTQTAGTVNAGDDLDIVAFSGTGTYNLRGGTLNVVGGTLGAGSGTIFSAAGSGTFNFTGGTLRLLEYSMPAKLMQNASNAASTLDVTANNTILDVGYNLNGAGSGANLMIGNNHTLTVHGELSVTAGTVTISQSSGAMSADQFISLANGTASGTFNLSGGSVSFGTLGFNVADQGGTGVLNLSGAGVINASATDDFFVGKSLSANGKVNQTGGILHLRSGGTLKLTNAATATGAYNLKGGLLDAAAATIAKGSGNGTFNFTGGTLRVATVAADMLDITQDAKDAPSTLDVTGNSTTINVNYTAAVSSGANVATVNVGSGKSLSLAGGKALNFGNQSTLQGAGQITGAAGSSLVYGSNLGSNFPGTLAGSLVLATTGNGSLTLGGANSYTGGTIVSGGTLATTATGSLGSSSGTLAINAIGAVSTLNLGNVQSVSSLSGTQSGAGSSANLSIGAAASLTVNQSGVTNFPGTLTNSGTFAKTGVGALEIDGAPALNGGSSLVVGGGTLRFNVTTGAATVGSGVTASVTAGATLELAGSVSALSSTVATVDRVAIANDSQAAAGGLFVSGTNQQVGAIDGLGNTVLGAAASLTANYICQNALVIGGAAGQLSTVTIAASNSSGNPTAEWLAAPSAGSELNFIAPLVESRSGAAEIGIAPQGVNLSSLSSSLVSADNAVPEPSSLVSLAITVAAIAMWRRKFAGRTARRSWNQFK